MIHVPDAFLTNILPVIRDQTVGRTAENTGGFKLLQNDPVIFHIDFQFIPLGDVQCAAQLDGQNDSSQLVHFPNDTC